MSQEQVEALRNLSAEITESAEATRNNIIAPRNDATARPQDDEDLKFVGGFGDIFVTIGLGLFLGALAYFARKIGGFWETPNNIGVAASCLITGGATWGLAEYFTRKRRMALPSIIMLLIFIVCCFVFFATIFTLGEEDKIFKNIRLSSIDQAQRWIYFSKVFATSMATAIFAAIYYWRFRVPIAIAGAVAVLGAIVVALIAAISPDAATHYTRYVILLYGLGVFVLAMRFDMSDPLRRTRRTDIAFWLHLLAAPLIVHPILNPIAWDKALTWEQAALIIAVFLLLGAVAIIIDRRAALVSSLSYAGVSFATLVKETGIASFTSESVPLTLITLGGFILLISVGWHPIRRLVLGWLPSKFTRHLYNPYPLGAAH
ncbi:MAG: hypothetical protein P8Y47_09390 [Alphaproteobacteria bacterium]